MFFVTLSHTEKRSRWRHWYHTIIEQFYWFWFFALFNATVYVIAFYGSVDSITHQLSLPDAFEISQFPLQGSSVTTFYWIFRCFGKLSTSLEFLPMADYYLGISIDIIDVAFPHQDPLYLRIEKFSYLTRLLLDLSSRTPHYLIKETNLVRYDDLT